MRSGVTEHGGHQVVEVVRDAAGELADGRHPLRRAGSASSRRCEVTSRMIPDTPTIEPVSSRIGDERHRHVDRGAVLRACGSSNRSTRSPATTRSMIRSDSSMWPEAESSQIFRPTAVAAVKPKIRSAAAFQLVTTDSRSVETIASSEPSTSAAR